jgi:hypothetical protein
MRVLAILAGIILLLPGLCSLGFIALFLPQVMGGQGASMANSPLILLWIACFAISYGGFLMISYGMRGRTAPPSE